MCAASRVEIIDNEVTKRNKMKILFIDDDLLLGQIITTALAEEGYEVCYQNSLAAMIAVAEEVKPDIVVLDVEIGEADGIEAIPQVHRVLPGVPVIIVSSHTQASEVVRAMDGELWVI